MTSTELLALAVGDELDAILTDLAKFEGGCSLCGGVHFEFGQSFPEWIKGRSWSYHDMLYKTENPYICKACLFSVYESYPMEGRDKPQKIRTYTHLVEKNEDGSYTWKPLTKASDNRIEMLSFLQSPHPHGDWFISIATSGQKHLLFMAKTNGPTHDTKSPINVQFETQPLTLIPDDLATVNAIYSELYTIFTKDEILTGQYKSKRVLDFGIQKLKKIENELSHWRGSSAFDLIHFLAVKQEDSNDE